MGLSVFFVMRRRRKQKKEAAGENEKETSLTIRESSLRLIKPKLVRFRNLRDMITGEKDCRDEDCFSSFLTYRRTLTTCTYRIED